MTETHRGYETQGQIGTRRNPVVAVLSKIASILAILVVSQIFMASPALAAPPDREPIYVDVGKSILVNLPSSSDTVFVADPAIADIQAPFPNKVFILGKATGHTTIFAIDDTGTTLLAREIHVQHNIANLRETLSDRFPTATIRLESSKGTLLLGGEVDTPEQAVAVEETVKPFLGSNEKLINHLRIGIPNKIRLKVRLMEASKDINEEFGINWQALFSPSDFLISLLTGRNFSITNGIPSRNGSQSAIGLGYDGNDVSVDSVIDFLEGEGLVSILAEPSLTALSGKAAKFLAGGEFPYPAPSGDNSTATVNYKPFGVQLEFKPVIRDTNTIALALKTEVSELSSSSVTINGTSVPQTLNRSIETEIELANGQSFAIGGLFQKTTRNSFSKTPGLGDVPILGKLFQSRSFLENKTELVIVVTPEIVPSRGSRLDATYLSSLRPITEVEFMFERELGQSDSRIPHSERPRLNGRAGFLY